jgi:hypothetical protein
MAKHRWLRRTIGLGLVAGAAYAVWRAIEQQSASEHRWESRPFPFPPEPRAATPASDATSASAPKSVLPEPGWVEPVDGACPASHPVKAKLASGIYHVPGGQSYERTSPDRCYTDAAAAEADGLRASKR